MKSKIILLHIFHILIHLLTTQAAHRSYKESVQYEYDPEPAVRSFNGHFHSGKPKNPFADYQYGPNIAYKEPDSELSGDLWAKPHGLSHNHDRDSTRKGHKRVKDRDRIRKDDYNSGDHRSKPSYYDRSRESHNRYYDSFENNQDKNRYSDESKEFSQKRLYVSSEDLNPIDIEYTRLDDSSSSDEVKVETERGRKRKRDRHVIVKRRPSFSIFKRHKYYNKPYTGLEDDPPLDFSRLADASSDENANAEGYDRYNYRIKNKPGPEVEDDYYPRYEVKRIPKLYKTNSKYYDRKSKYDSRSRDRHNRYESEDSSDYKPRFRVNNKPGHYLANSEENYKAKKLFARISELLEEKPTENDYVELNRNHQYSSAGNDRVNNRYELGRTTQNIIFKYRSKPRYNSNRYHKPRLFDLPKTAQQHRNSDEAHQLAMNETIDFDDLFTPAYDQLFGTHRKPPYFQKKNSDLILMR